MKALNIVLASMKDKAYQVFVEIEDDDGKSYKAGTYIKGRDFDRIRITEEDLRECVIESVQNVDTGAPTAPLPTSTGVNTVK